MLKYIDCTGNVSKGEIIKNLTSFHYLMYNKYKNSIALINSKLEELSEKEIILLKDINPHLYFEYHTFSKLYKLEIKMSGYDTFGYWNEYGIELYYKDTNGNIHDIVEIFDRDFIISEVKKNIIAKCDI